MIKYRLICKDCETTFDSWFSSSKDYERLKRKNFTAYTMDLTKKYIEINADYRS